MAEQRWRTRLYRFVDSPIRYLAFAIVGLLAALLFGDWASPGWLIAKFVIGVALFVMLGLAVWLARRRLIALRPRVKPPLDLSR